MTQKTVLGPKKLQLRIEPSTTKIPDLIQPVQPVTQKVVASELKSTGIDGNKKPAPFKNKQNQEFPSWAGEMNPTRNHEVVGSIPGLDQWVTDPTLL